MEHVDYSEYSRSEKAIEMSEKAMRFVLRTRGARHATVLDEKTGYRVRATKKISGTKYYGELLITIGRPNSGEKDKIKRLKKNNGGKVPEGCFATINKGLWAREGFLEN